MAEHTVTVYSTNTCPWCVKAKSYLQQRGIPYTEKKVDQDRTAAMEMIRLSGQQGVPVIAIDDQVVVGFNKPRIDELLNRPAAQRPAEPKRRTLGAQVADAGTITLRNSGHATDGAYVGGVRQGSPAEFGGIRSGDVITAVNGKPVNNAADLELLMAGTLPGSRLVITIQRNGNERDIETSL